MKLHLTYDGPLPSGAKDTLNGQYIKHRIRERFSAALRRKWTQQNPVLMDFYTKGLPEESFAENRFCRDDAVAPFFRMFTNGYHFIPLVNRRNRLLCDVTVTLHRREGAFQPVSGGDLDNRVKTLLDALRMPRKAAEIPGNLVGHGEEMFSLLEDDSLLCRLCIETTPRTDYDEAKPSPSEDSADDPVMVQVVAILKQDESEMPHSGVPSTFLLGA